MKKNKIIVGIVATMCNIPISLVLASIIHIQLSKIDVPKTLYDLRKIVVNEKLVDEKIESSGKNLTVVPLLFVLPIFFKGTAT